jgi:hypothetical protein
MMNFVGFDRLFRTSLKKTRQTQGKNKIQAFSENIGKQTKQKAKASGTSFSAKEVPHWPSNPKTFSRSHSTDHKASSNSNCGKRKDTGFFLCRANPSLRHGAKSLLRLCHPNRASRG